MRISFCYPLNTNVYYPRPLLKAFCDLIGGGDCRFWLDGSKIAKSMDSSGITWDWGGDDPRGVDSCYADVVAAGFAPYIDIGGTPPFASGGIPTYSSGDGADLHIGCTAWNWTIQVQWSDITANEKIVLAPDSAFPVTGTVLSVDQTADGSKTVLKLNAYVRRWPERPADSWDMTPWVVAVNVAPPPPPVALQALVGQIVQVRGTCVAAGSTIRFADERSYCTTDVADIDPNFWFLAGRDVVEHFPDALAYECGNEWDERLSFPPMHGDQNLQPGFGDAIVTRLFPQILTPFTRGVRSANPNAITYGSETTYDGGTYRVHAEANRLWQALRATDPLFEKPHFDKPTFHPYGGQESGWPGTFVDQANKHLAAVKRACLEHGVQDDRPKIIGECQPPSPMDTGRLLLEVHNKLGTQIEAIAILDGLNPNQHIGPDLKPTAAGLALKAAILQINGKRRAAGK